MFKKNHISLLATLTLLVVIIVAGFIAPKTRTQVSAQSGYSLIWSDEFNGSSLDTNKWSYQNGTWNGSSVQNCYTPDNTSVSGGSLKITSRYEPSYACFSQTRDFTSGFVQTKDKVSWTYGYFEARIKMPASNSTWPAFWMSPQTATYGSWPSSGEIDIFEAKGYDTSQVKANAHWGLSSSNKQQRSKAVSVDSITNWHLYGLEWEEGILKFYLDGVLYHTITNFSSPNATTDPGPFNIPFYLRLNMAVGGTYLEAPHNDANNNLGEFPAVMEVDYVRVYEKQTASSTPTSAPTPAPTPAETDNDSSSNDIVSSTNNDQSLDSSNSPSSSNTVQSEDADILIKENGDVIKVQNTEEDQNKNSIIEKLNPATILDSSDEYRELKVGAAILATVSIFAATGTLIWYFLPYIKHLLHR
jgi:beta-glucanase (GH16 family)